MAQALRWLAGFVWNNPRLSLGIAVGLWLAFAVRRWRRGKAELSKDEQLRTLKDHVRQLEKKIKDMGGAVPKPPVTPPALPQKTPGATTARRAPHAARRTPAKTPFKAGSVLKTSATPAPAPAPETSGAGAAAGTVEADSSARQEPTLTPSSAQFLAGIAESTTPQPAEAAAGGVAAAGAAAAAAEPGEGGGGPERTTSLSPFLQVPGIGKKKKGKKRAD